jgi:hypothetical protein
MATFTEFVADGKRRGKTREQVARGVEIYRERFGAFDDEQAPAIDFGVPVPPVDVKENPLDGLPEEERNALSEYMSDESTQLVNATNWYNDRDSTNYTPQEVEGNVKFEYGENATPAVANKDHAKVSDFQAQQEQKMQEYADRTSVFFKTPEVGRAVMESVRKRKELPPPVGYMAPQEARDYRQQKMAEYEEWKKALPIEQFIEVERAEDREEREKLLKPWRGKDKDQMPPSVRRRIEEIDKAYGITDTEFEQRVLGGRATRGIDVFQFSRYATHKEQQIAVDVNVDSKETAQDKIDRLHEMQDSASVTLPKGKGVGKVWYGALGSVGPMGESIIAGGLTGGMADKVYWATQGQGSIISDYVRENNKKLTNMSDAEYQRLQDVSKVAGGIYAATEFVGGVYGLQKFAPVKKAQQKLVSEAVKNPALANRIVKGGSKFVWEWLKENSEEGMQGFITEVGRQAIEQDIDLGEAVGEAGKQFVEAAPGTLGITLLGGGGRSGYSKVMSLGATNRIRKQNTDSALDQLVEDGVLTQEQVDVVKTPEAERPKAVDQYNQAQVEEVEDAIQEREAEEVSVREETKRGEEVQQAREEVGTEERAPETQVTAPAEMRETDPEVLMEQNPEMTEDEALNLAIENEAFNNRQTQEEFVPMEVPPLPAEEDQTIVEERTERPDGWQDAVGVSRRNNEAIIEANQQAGLMLGYELSQAEREKQTETLEQSAESKIAPQTIVNRVLDKKSKKEDRQLTNVEVGVLMIRQAELTNQIEETTQQMEDALARSDSGSQQDFQEAMELRRALTVEQMQLMEAARTGATENARALAMMGAMIDRKSFTLSNVIAKATQTKGEELSTTEQEKAEELVEELEMVEQQLAEEAEGEADARQQLLDEIDLMFRRMRKPGRSKKDKNADLKELKKRQDKIFALIDEINSGKPKKEKIEKVMEPDSRAYHYMINALQAELATKREGDAKVRANIKLIDKRDALLAEIENMHRDITETVEQLEKTKLEKDIETYRQARSDQDAIAKLLAELRGDVEQKGTVTKEDIYGYKQTIAELRKQISDKKIVEKTEQQIAELEQAIEEGDLDYGTLDKAETKRVAESVKKVRERKAELKKQLADMRADRDRLNKIKMEAQDLLQEVETVSRRVQKKKEKGQDVNADLKLLKRRQDQVIDLVNRINEGAPKAERIQKVAEPDSGGYLDMIQNLKQKLKTTQLENEIKQMEADLAADPKTGALDKYMKEPPTKKDLDKWEQRQQDLQLKKRDLQKRIQRMIRQLKPKTLIDRARDVRDLFRSAKLTADVGHILRQGGFIISNPFNINAWKFVWNSLGTMKSQEKADLIQLSIESDPQYRESVNAGVHYIVEGMSLSEREMAMMENLWDKVPGINRVTRASERTQSVMTNYLRLQSYKAYTKRAPGMSAKQKKETATAVNIVTGYSGHRSITAIAQHADWLLTSTQFTASRLQMPFVGIWAMKQGNTHLAKKILADSAWFWGVRLGIMTMLKSAFDDEIDIGTDPEHHTFGKLIVHLPNDTIRIYDPWAGLQQVARIAGNVTGGDRVMESIMTHLANKENPMWSGFWAVVQGKKYPREDVHRMEALTRSVIPISLEGMFDSFADDTPLWDGMVASTLDLVGINSYTMNADDLDLEETNWGGFVERHKERIEERADEDLTFFGL